MENELATKEDKAIAITNNYGKVLDTELTKMQSTLRLLKDQMLQAEKAISRMEGQRDLIKQFQTEYSR
jgi:hypothetical protein